MMEKEDMTVKCTIRTNWNVSGLFENKISMVQNKIRITQCQVHIYSRLNVSKLIVVDLYRFILI